MLHQDPRRSSEAPEIPGHVYQSNSSAANGSEARPTSEPAPRQLSSNPLQAALNSASGLLLCGKASLAFERQVVSLRDDEQAFALPQTNLGSSFAITVGRLEIPGFQTVPTFPSEVTYNRTIDTIPRMELGPAVPRYGFIELDVQAPSRVPATSLRGSLANLFASKDSGQRIVTITLAPPAALEGVSADLARNDRKNGYLVGLHAVVSRDAADALLKEVLRGKSRSLLQDLFANQASGIGASLLSVIQKTMIDPLCQSSSYGSRLAVLDRHYHAFAAGFDAQNAYSRALRARSS
jgi:hypothetical protein